MNTRRILFGAAVLAVATVAVLPDAGEPAQVDAHIRDLNFGSYWYGAQVEPNDLKGKVVLVEIWGS